MLRLKKIIRTEVPELNEEYEAMIEKIKEQEIENQKVTRELRDRRNESRNND